MNTLLPLNLHIFISNIKPIIANLHYLHYQLASLLYFFNYLRLLVLFLHILAIILLFKKAVNLANFTIILFLLKIRFKFKFYRFLSYANIHWLYQYFSKVKYFFIKVITFHLSHFKFAKNNHFFKSNSSFESPLISLLSKKAFFMHFLFLFLTISNSFANFSY